MREIPLAEVPLAGLFEREFTRDGMLLHRLPGWVRRRNSHPMYTLFSTMPSGVRLEALTTTAALELDVSVKVFQHGDVPPSTAVFDLVVDGELRASRSSTGAELVVADPKTFELNVLPGTPETIRFERLPREGSGLVEVWFPSGAAVEVRAVRVSDGASLSPAPTGARRWVHYGSSISHCMEATRPTATWPAIAARLAAVDLINLSIAGECMLDPAVARTIRDLNVDLISIKAGINVVGADAMREYAFVPALHGFLDIIRERHPRTPVVLATPIVCPVVEDHPGPTTFGPDGQLQAVPRPSELAGGALTLQRIRELTADIVHVRRTEGDNRLYFLDGLSLLGAADISTLSDGLHPSAEGYVRIGERFHRLAFCVGGPFSQDVMSEVEVEVEG